MSIPLTGNLPLPQEASTAAVSCLPPDTRSVVLLQDLLLTCKPPLPVKPQMSLSLTLGSFFGLGAGQVQAL